VSRKNVRASGGRAKAVRRITKADAPPSSSDVTSEAPDPAEFYRSVKKYFDRAERDGAYFYIARQSVRLAWLFRGVPSDTERHKRARNLARLGHAALRAHRTGDSSLARQRWLEAERAYERLLLMGFAADLSSKRIVKSEQQSKIAKQARKPGLRSSNDAIRRVFKRLIRERQEPRLSRRRMRWTPRFIGPTCSPCSRVSDLFLRVCLCFFLRLLRLHFGLVSSVTAHDLRHVR
jgi:hypothetical protein